MTRIISSLCFACLVLACACSDSDSTSTSDGQDAAPETEGDASCGAEGNLVPVSCDAFPASPACDPFGTWSLTYVDDYPGVCVSVDISQLMVARGADDVARVGFGVTESATLSDDGCEVVVNSARRWTNPSEVGLVSHALTLSLSGDSGTGELDYTESGQCSGSGKTSVTAQRIAP